MNKSAKAVFITAFLVAVILGVYFLVIKKNVADYEESNRAKQADNFNLPDKLSVTINSKKYSFSLEKNKTVEEFVNMFPLYLEMHDKTSETKSAFIYTKLSTNKLKYKEIEAGDIFLDGDSTVVLFVKPNKVGGKYTKLGHVDNFDSVINSGETMVYFSK